MYKSYGVSFSLFLNPNLPQFSSRINATVHWIWRCNVAGLGVGKAVGQILQSVDTVGFLGICNSRADLGSQIPAGRVEHLEGVRSS